ncbi:hypothetical protein ACIBCT_12065 [Streptosporangium sp. NPDC050855]|uniref:hypothetical protein n=1 Tax=Streptosporangium sp. NPDC050855 TaxID=3366194 RepID=UPI003794E8A8
MRRATGGMALISVVALTVPSTSATTANATTANGTTTSTTTASATTASATTADAATGRPAAERPVIGVVKGSGRIAYPDPDDDVRFTVDATVTYRPGELDPFAGEARGTARVRHHFANAPTPTTVWADVSVDCVLTGGRSATVTGFVTAASANNADWVGQRVGFSVTDNGAGRFDRIGWSGPRLAGDPELRRCAAPAPFFRVKAGGYTVKDVSPFPG